MERSTFIVDRRGLALPTRWSPFERGVWSGESRVSRAAECKYIPISAASPRMATNAWECEAAAVDDKRRPLHSEN